MILATSLGYSYGPKQALSGVSFSIERGEAAVITGRNGAGKSTLLDLMVGDLVPTEGTLVVSGSPAVQYLPQSSLSLGRLTCREAIELVQGLTQLRADEFNRFTEAIPSDLIRERVRAVAHAFLWQVSGGERQLVLLSLALSRQADLYLLDEPFNFLDEDAREASIAWIERLRRHGATVVLVAHRPDDVKCLRPDRRIGLN